MLPPSVETKLGQRNPNVSFPPLQRVSYRYLQKKNVTTMIKKSNKPNELKLTSNI